MKKLDKLFFCESDNFINQWEPNIIRRIKNIH